MKGCNNVVLIRVSNRVTNKVFNTFLPVEPDQSQKTYISVSVEVMKGINHLEVECKS